MLNVKRMLVWLSRIHRCRGFGVQSPWAYRMVRYVINEHYPYYAYEDLRAAYPHMDADTRRLCELSLRLANSVRPAWAAVDDACGEEFRAYIKAGCRSVSFLKDIGECRAKNNGECIFAVLSTQEGLSETFYKVADAANNGSVALIMGIHGNKAARMLWREVVSGVKNVVTFDLYYCGLVFFDDKRFKQNYIINF